MKLLALILISVVSLAHAACPAAVNDAALKLIEKFQGFTPYPVMEPSGTQTVGYGHRCRARGCSEIPYRFPLTRAQGETILRGDTAPMSECLGNYIHSTVKLNSNQFGALISWVLNIGCGNARTSALVQRLNNGEDPNIVASQELPQWNKEGGKVMPGLVRRRKEEVQLFQTPSNEAALPC